MQRECHPQKVLAEELGETTGLGPHFSLALLLGQQSAEGWGGVYPCQGTNDSDFAFSFIIEDSKATNVRQLPAYVHSSG